MMQLSYQPAFDPYHAVYRFLRLCKTVLAGRSLHEDHLRILDFYLLFPFRIDEIRLKRPHQKFKKLAKKFEKAKPYGELPEDKVLFARMQPLQTAALDTLATKDLIDAELYRTGTIGTTDEQVSAQVAERIRADNETQKDLIEFLTVLATEYELLGDDGLKDRTKLMEYRYDAI